MSTTDELKNLRKRIAQLEDENASLKDKLDFLMENAFRENEIKFKTIFNNSNEGIVLIDENGLILDWNLRIEKVTGLAREMALNRYIWDVQFSFMASEQKRSLPPDFLKLAWEKEVLNMPLDHTVTGHGEIIAKGGKKEFIEDFVKPVTIEGKRYYIVFQRYLTEQKKAEKPSQDRSST